MNERVIPNQAPMLDYDALLQSNLREKDRVKILILRYIQEEGTASRKMVVEALSMRPSTVSKSISEMIEDGILLELPHKANFGRGRPEWFLELSKDRFWVISFSIMSMTLIASIVNINGDIVDNITEDLSHDLDATMMTNTLNRLIKSLQRKVPSGTTLLGYGFAVPGLIDKQAKMWRMVSRFPRIKNLEFENVIGFREGNVFFERNIDTILNYCLLSQPGAQSGTALLLHWGYGIAISCSMEGNLIQSNGGLFGEIGHWTVNLENDSTETIESIAAIPKLMDIYNWNDSLDEVSIQKSVEGGFVDNVEVQRIIDIIIRVLRNLHLSFFPDIIYILSPFVDMRAIRHITMELTKLLKPFTIKSPEIVPLEYSSHSESLGIANTIFSRTIQPHLIARW